MPIKLIIIVLSFLFVSGCRGGVESRPYHIVASFDLLEDWCTQITPEEIRIHSLAHGQPGTHPIFYTMRDAFALSQAKMYISMGHQVDETFFPLMQHYALQSTRWLILEDWEENQIHDMISTENKEKQPQYLWLDLIWTQNAIREISAHLQELFPTYADSIEEATQAYLLTLHDRYVFWNKLFETLPPESIVRVSPCFRPWIERFQLPEVKWLTPTSEEQKKQKDSLLSALPNDNPFVLVKKAEIQNSNKSVLKIHPFVNKKDPECDTYIKMIDHLGQRFLEGYGVENDSNRPATNRDVD